MRLKLGGVFFATGLAAMALTAVSCNNGSSLQSSQNADAASASFLSTSAVNCRVIEQGYGPDGQVPIRADVVVSGLDTPWGIAFLSPTEFLVTERDGRVRLVRGGALVPEPVITLPQVQSSSESGLMGIALHPDFVNNRLFYLYYTASTNGNSINRIERFRLASDSLSAKSDRVIFDGISSASFHDGGRIHFGPDGQLYVGTGDARTPSSSQDPASPSGKILRLTPDGAVPTDNPQPDSPVFISGVRNVQAFDWMNFASGQYLAIADHGPTGELGRRGHDELSLARAGDNLGWPEQWRCADAPGRTKPLMVWQNALPPGGLVHYTGSLIPEWQGSLLIATLRSEHLQRVRIVEDNGTLTVVQQEVYLRGQFGRLREAVQGPDGALYVTTSNCDGRGTCGANGDQIIRISK